LSAVNFVTLDGKTGYLLTDTWATSPIGGVRVAKVLPLAHSRSVVAARGGEVGKICAFACAAAFPSFDDAEQGLPKTLAQNWPAISAQKGGSGLFELVMAGWSEKRNQIACLHCLAPDFAVSIRSFLYGPGISEDQIAAAGVECREGQVVITDPIADLIRIMVAQRNRRKVSDDDVPERIGGSAVLTVIKRDLIEQRVVYRWPDEFADMHGA
jgi:hypothetical protein